jgi:hypothetical protein
MHRMLIAAGFAVPALLFGAAAWRSYSDIRLEGEATPCCRIRCAATFKPRSWRSPPRRTIYAASIGVRLEALRPGHTCALARSTDQIAAISIADRDGIVRSTSNGRSTGGRVQRGAIFKADRGENFYLGVAYTGRSGRAVSLALIKTRAGPDGGLDGTIRADLDPGYLSRLLAEFETSGRDAV